jgi:hypothetical protein
MIGTGCRNPQIKQIGGAIAPATTERNVMDKPIKTAVLAKVAKPREGNPPLQKFWLKPPRDVAPEPERAGLAGHSDGLREVQDAWRRQHWPTHRRGVGAHPKGSDDTWAADGGDGPDACDGAGSDDWREAAGGAEMITVGGAEKDRRGSLAALLS